MNDDDFFLAELGVIELPDIEAYFPTDFQRQYLTMLENGIKTGGYRLREKLFCFAGDNSMIPRDANGTGLSDEALPFTFEHTELIIHIRESRRAGLSARKLHEDWLVKKMNPAFELLRNLTHKNQSFYITDLDRRWNIAGNACNWEGVKRLPDRKIALTNSPIWVMLGSNELFDDGLGFDTPPFFLNGGYLFGWRSITKKELESLP